MIEIFNINYNEYINLIGTAHFTQRSINEAYEAIGTYKPKDIAVELDWDRFRKLNSSCLSCPKYSECKGICEFTVAAKALGNVDANVWLIDMSEVEMKQRITMRTTSYERIYREPSAYLHRIGDPISLWERGYKERVVEDSKRQIETLRKVYPSVWGVLIDERNALMATRLAWIVSKNLDAEVKGKTIALVGAAHVEGIKSLLASPSKMKQELDKFGLAFTQPTLVRRVAVQEN